MSLVVPMTLPPLTPDLFSSWIPPSTLAAAFIALFASVVQGLKGDIRATEARLDKRIDEVREEIKEVKAEIKEVRAEIKEVRAEIKALESKLDRVLEKFLTVQS